jgi:hypothetical protein
MVMVRICTLLLPLLFFTGIFSHAQTDSTVSRHRRDSSYYRLTNPNKNGIWGNSTYFAAGVNFARNKEFDFTIGRTYGKGLFAPRGLGYYQLHSWGAGYSITRAGGKDHHGLKTFYEYDFFPFVIVFNFGVRGEYLYDLTSKQHYLRPAIGMTLVHLDLLYNYSFLLNKKEAGNIYRHGLSLRLKYFHSKRNWERSEFVRKTPL